MQAGILLITYVLTMIAVQLVGFVVSRLVDYQFPAVSLMAFLVIFIAAFGIAWPIAVWIAERLIQRAGYQLEKADPRAV